MDLKERYEMARMQSYEEDKPTPISLRGFATLKIILMLTMMHIETLIILSAINFFQPNLFWTCELVIALVLLLRIPGGWINRQFTGAYEIVEKEKDFVNEIDGRVQRNVTIKEAL